jgi:pyridoxine 4-dehydrogenase
MTEPSMDVSLPGGPTFPRLGYGAMHLTGQPRNFGPYRDITAGIALLRRTYARGVRFIDTAHAYGPGHNEELIARAFDPYPDDLIVATKVGVEKPAWDVIHPDGSPEAIGRGVRESLQRLRRERLDLVYLHRPDPAVPIEESVGALARLREQGFIAHIGVSNVDVDQLARAQSVTDIAAVQNRYSLGDRSDDLLVDLVGEEGMLYVPYGPLGVNPIAAEARRNDDAVSLVAARYGATAAQVALAWLLARAPHVCPIPGTTKTQHLDQNMAAMHLVLTDADLSDLEQPT